MRNTGALEEADLTQDTNDQEPTPTTPPEASEPETTDLVPTQPDVIEGEVIIIEQPEETTDHTRPKQTPYWLLIPFTIFVCLVFLVASFLLPLLTPSATITIIPAERTITTTALIQVHGRQIALLTLSQSTTVPATGMRHQDPTRASGTITFYNGLLTSQTIAAGTILTGSDDTQIVTDRVAVIPAANPPIEGQATISAHARIPGAQGNIPAYDIHQACCADSVFAKNTRAFTGGAQARDVIVVTREDITNAASPLKTGIDPKKWRLQSWRLHLG